MTVRDALLRRSMPMPSLLPGPAALLAAGLLAGCSTPAPSAMPAPKCPEATAPRLTADAPPRPTEPLPLAPPWAPAAPVERHPLVVGHAASSSLATWDESELGLRGPSEPATVPGAVRGFLFAAVAPGADPGPYSFAGPRGVPARAFFVSDGRGMGFVKATRRTLEDGRKLQVDVAQLPPGVANPWKLSRSIHLVDVEVNGGRGDATKDQLFVITNVRVLDGSEVLPLDLEAATATLSARAAERLKGLEREAARTLKDAETELPAGTLRDTRDEERGVTRELRLNWDDAKRALSLVHLERRRSRYEAPPHPLPVTCAPGAPCQQQVEYPVFEIEVTQAVRQVVTADGVLTEETTFRPRAVRSRVQ